MRLADGQPVDPPLARHAAGCGLCAALVSAFRDEGLSLRAALILDEAELAFLATAGLPARVASRVPFLAVQRDSPATLLAMLITALAGYAGWLLAQPVVGAGMDLAERSGVGVVATRVVTDWLIGLLFTLWDVLSTAGAMTVLQNPALPLALVALLAWLAIWLGPRLSLPATGARAAA
jgi:hypothetical protein